MTKKIYANEHPKNKKKDQDKNVKVARSSGMNKRRQAFYDEVEFQEERSLAWKGHGLSEADILAIRKKMLGR